MNVIVFAVCVLSILMLVCVSGATQGPGPAAGAVSAIPALAPHPRDEPSHPSCALPQVSLDFVFVGVFPQDRPMGGCLQATRNIVP